MARTIWRVTETGLVPTDTDALEALRAHKVGSEVMADPKGARNPKQLRLFWALCDVVAHHDEHYTDKVRAKEGILRALEHVDTFVDRKGNLHISTKSIAFESMTQAEFNRLFDRAIHVVVQWLGWQPSHVQDHVNQMIADKRWSPQKTPKMIEDERRNIIMIEDHTKK